MGTEEKVDTVDSVAAKEENSSFTHQSIRQTLLISAAGNVVCSWGRGEDGQLGHGDAEDRFLPVQLSALDRYEVNSITCGADHTLAYSEPLLQVFSWGWGDFGRLGHGNSSDLFIPQPIKAFDGIKIKQIACGDSHCLAVTMDGEVASWGRNQNGQIGIGTTEDVLVPQKITTFQGTPVKMVAAGAEHSAAVTEAGEVYGWGWGRYGNLGLGDRKDRLVPEKVPEIDGIKMILVACGWRHTITVTSSGSIYTYGWSKYGQLGHGDFEDHLTPYKLEALSGQIISQVDGDIPWQSPRMECFMVGDGIRHTLAVTDRNNVFSWGRGTNGQLGHGDSSDRKSKKIIHLYPTNCRNSPTMLEALSMDGSCGQKIESSKADPLAGKIYVPPSGRYAVVPDETEIAAGSRDNGGDASVPENDVKRIRLGTGPAL
ncbi:Ultraviolet-B receptor UVR8 [Bienertia sinuspersici]